MLMINAKILLKQIYNIKMLLFNDIICNYYYYFVIIFTIIIDL